MADTVPAGSVPIIAATTGTTAGSTINLGTTAFTGRTVYLTGISYQATGATAASATTTLGVTYLNFAGAQVSLGTGGFTLLVGAGATVAQPPFTVNFIPPMAAGLSILGPTAGSNQGIIQINIGAPPAGTTAWTCNAWGYIL